MNTITIITIVVVALLTAVVFGLAWLGYGFCIRGYRTEVRHGEHDKEILGAKQASKRKRRIGETVATIASYAIVAVLSSVFVTGIVYKARGENLSFNGQTALVIKSGSMSEFHDEGLAERYAALGYDPSLQFDVGDICLFEGMHADAEPIEGEVYGYRYKNVVITHRLVGTYDGGGYEFRGDNNPVSDGLSVGRDDIIYHYTGHKAPGVGAFVLYAQSPFGIWSLAGITGIIVSSEVVYHKIRKIEDGRYAELEDEGHEA